MAKINLKVTNQFSSKSVQSKSVYNPTKYAMLCQIKSFYERRVRAVLKFKKRLRRELKLNTYSASIWYSYDFSTMFSAIIPVENVVR